MVAFTNSSFLIGAPTKSYVPFKIGCKPLFVFLSKIVMVSYGARSIKVFSFLSKYPIVYLNCDASDIICALKLVSSGCVFLHDTQKLIKAMSRIKRCMVLGIVFN